MHARARHARAMAETPRRVSGPSVPQGRIIMVHLVRAGTAVALDSLLFRDTSKCPTACGPASLLVRIDCTRVRNRLSGGVREVHVLLLCTTTSAQEKAQQRCISWRAGLTGARTDRVCGRTQQHETAVFGSYGQNDAPRCRNWCSGEVAKGYDV